MHRHHDGAGDRLAAGAVRAPGRHGPRPDAQGRSLPALDRRRWLKLAGGALAGGMAAACASPRGGLWLPAPPRSPVRPVRVSRDRIIRAVAGLRPYRAEGFVVRAERLGSKLLVHNYGHGGGGVTLSWGTADMAAELVIDSGREGDVAVLGAGAVGLATARLLQRRGRTVTIYTRDLPPNTTSNMAGAQWSPSTVSDNLDGPFGDQFERAARLAYRHFQNLVGPDYGVRWIDNYFVGEERPVRSGIHLPDTGPLPRMGGARGRRTPLPHPLRPSGRDDVHRATALPAGPAA